MATAATGEDGLKLLREQRPDLIVLDVMLPGIDGFEVCRRIRRTDQLPIILLTARSDDIDVVVGLESGADDYVVKPVQGRVLDARIRAVLRRGERESQRLGRPSARLVIDRAAMTVTKNGEDLQLTPTELRLLLELSRRPGQALSRQQLLRLVWEHDYLGDSRLVDACVQRLRAKVEDVPSSPDADPYRARRRLPPGRASVTERKGGSAAGPRRAGDDCHGCAAPACGCGWSWCSALVALTAAVSASGIAYWLNREAVLTRTQDAVLRRLPAGDAEPRRRAAGASHAGRTAAHRGPDGRQQPAVQRAAGRRRTAAARRSYGNSGGLNAFSLDDVPESLRTAVEQAAARRRRQQVAVPPVLAADRRPRHAVPGGRARR